MEIWKDIPGYEGRYQVSNEGNVKSLNYLTHGTEKNMKLSCHHNGYLVVSLGKHPSKSYSVHRLVASAFIPPIKGKNIVNHKDGNKKNNHVENLEWVTYKENTEHAISTGLRNPHDIPKKFSKDHYSSKPVLQYSHDGKFIKKWDCQSDVTRAYGLGHGSVSNFVDKPTKLLCGYMWVSYTGEIKLQIEPSKSRFAPVKVNQYDTNGNLICRWDDARIAAKELGITVKGIKDCCRGHQKSSGGFKWSF